ncbi:MAG: SRPBCC family protein [Neomegalonema sp.]|nr:SRPBCC family protein [Neomegalonema sp.]
MKTFDVQSVGIEASATSAFAYIADGANLPKWTNAFKSVDGERAVLETAQGAVQIKLEVIAHKETGVVDWRMTFPDGSVGHAHSRVTPDGDARAVYSFVLMAPPVPLEALEGALDAQRALLAEELPRLKAMIEKQ